MLIFSKHTYTPTLTSIIFLQYLILQLFKLCAKGHFSCRILLFTKKISGNMFCLLLFYI